MPLERDLQRIEAAMEALARVSQGRTAAAVRAARAGLHLTGTAQQVLRRVIESAPVRVSDLARQVQMGDAAVSRQVTALEEQGLVTRSPSPEDRRVALVRPTSLGRGAGRRLRRAADGIFAEHLASWSSKDLASLALLMERLARDLRNERRGGPREEMH
jgi:DNA-binding MarR family transcriptional regulator